MKSFTDLPDLANERVGGRVLYANDDFFAEKENLLLAKEPVWKEGVYTERGKWMDGWESRRRREPGYDWAIVQLGLPGTVHGVIVDTAFFRGNFPESCSIDACDVPPGTDVEALVARDADTGVGAAVKWREIVPRTTLDGDTRHELIVKDPGRVTHLRLNIYPDGGVARLRVHGYVSADWDRVDALGEQVDLVAIENGGRTLVSSDECFGKAASLLMLGTAANIGDGWETRRRRGPGHDWTIIKLGATGIVERAVVDTRPFIGNAPGSCALEWCHSDDSIDVLTSDACPWMPLLPETKLAPNREQMFEDELAPMGAATHVRFRIYPDGGVARLRLYGTSERALAMRIGLEALNATDEADFREQIRPCCESDRWIADMAAARPFDSVHSLLQAAQHTWSALDSEDWLQAFAAHPQIGEKKQGSGAFARWSKDEQSGVDSAAMQTLTDLAEANLAYFERFGYIFIICASGKSAAHMLSVLRERMTNVPDIELSIAAQEEAKITQLRVQRLLQSLAQETETAGNVS